MSAGIRVPNGCIRSANLLSDLNEAKHLNDHLIDRCCQSCLIVPLPVSLSQELSSPDQSAELQPQNRAVVWKVPRFPGGTQLSAVFKVRKSAAITTL